MNKPIVKRIFIFLFVLFFSVKVYGEEKEDKYILFYFESNSSSEQWASIEYKFNNEFSRDYKIFYVFEQLFSNNEFINFVPEGTKLLGIEVIEDRLIINVSSEINNHGGSYYETYLIKQITRTGLSIKNINFVTLLIDGELTYLSEGLYIDRISDWNAH